MLRKALTALVAVPGLLLLAGCGSSGTEQMAEHLDNSDEDDVVMVSLSGVYGDEWETFYVVCPETDRSTVSQMIGVPESDLPEMESEGSDNAIVYTNGDDTGYELFEVDDVQLCSGGMAPLAYEFTADLVSVTPTSDDSWWLTSRDLEQAGS